MISARRAEIVKNYAFFKSVVGSMMAEHADRFALIHESKVIDTYDTAGEAVSDGARLFGEYPFSVQRVINRPIDLGFLSHASDNGIVI